MQAGIRASPSLVDSVAALETIQAEGRVELMGPILRNGVRKAPSGCRRRLEAAVAPASVEIEISIGVPPMMGLPSIVMSMTPAQCRMMRNRPKLGNAVTAAAATCSIIGKLPRWAYEL